MTKEEILKEFEDINEAYNNCTKYDTLKRMIDEVTKPKSGHWIIHPQGIYAHLVCDKCISYAPYDCKTNYCPNCGAKMESEGLWDALYKHMGL